jgi:hypothetical protein
VKRFAHVVKRRPVWTCATPTSTLCVMGCHEQFHRYLASAVRLS